MPGKNVPDITEDSLRDLLEAQGLSVHSVAFDSPGASETKRFAYVRLTPPTPQWLAKSEPSAEVRSQAPTWPITSDLKNRIMPMCAGGTGKMLSTSLATSPVG